MGQTLFRSYGRFFAEFLEDLSLVRLGLLALITCVGLRYGFRLCNLEVFLGRLFDSIYSAEAEHFAIIESDIKVSIVDLPAIRFYKQRLQSNKEHYLIFPVPP